MRQQVGSHSRVVQGKIFDAGISQHLTHHRKDFFTPDCAHGIEGKIQQFKHIKLTKPGYPVFVVLHLAGGVHSTHKRPHGAPGNSHNVIATLDQHLDGADVRIATGAATTECERNGLAFAFATLGFGTGRGLRS